MHAWPSQAAETSVEIKLQKVELASLTGQQLIIRIRLFREVHWALRDCQQCHWHYEQSIQSSVGELAEERLWLLQAAVPRRHYQNLFHGPN